MNKTNLIFIAVLVLILVGGYYAFTVFGPQEAVPDEDLIKKETAREDFLKIINKLNKITVNIDFFSSEDFTQLKDLGVIVEQPEEVGRSNPFLPF